MPYLFSGVIPDFFNAFFESTSGITTTGASILTNIEGSPKSILFWRQLTHWIGGIGIILLIIIILPSLKIRTQQFLTLESSLKEKILPKTKSIGLRLLYVYLTLTFAETLLLWLGEMDLFDSVCHAFTTIATGGFSTKNDSIASCSPYTQNVISVFMYLSGISFVLFYFIVKKKFNKVYTNEELWFYTAIVL
ncbi:MAG: TrkH family potassium uptake protein, partial [Bacteroidales bacterium]|nr:TrkH family potassium uptake protein [Bacteroidales bacterium]